MQRQNAEQLPIHCPCGRAPRQNASSRRLHPLSGAAAVQRGEKRIQGGSRGNSQSPYPSLAAGGCHKAAAAANSGARTPLQTPQCRKRTQSNAHIPCDCGGAPRKNAAPRRLQPLSGAAAFQGVKENPRMARVGRAQRDWSAAAVQPHGTLGALAHSAEPRNRNPPIPSWPPEAATW